MITKKMAHGRYDLDIERGRFAYFCNYCPNCETKVYMDNDELDQFLKTNHWTWKTVIGEWATYFVPKFIKNRIIEQKTMYLRAVENHEI